MDKSVCVCMQQKPSRWILFVSLECFLTAEYQAVISDMEENDAVATQRSLGRLSQKPVQQLAKTHDIWSCGKTSDSKPYGLPPLRKMNELGTGNCEWASPVCLYSRCVKRNIVLRGWWITFAARRETLTSWWDGLHVVVTWFVSSPDVCRLVNLLLFRLCFLLQVACMQFINIVVHSVEDMNFRVHLQFEFTKLGLDDYLEVKRWICYTCACLW